MTGIIPLFPLYNTITESVKTEKYIKIHYDIAVKHWQQQSLVHCPCSFTSLLCLCTFINRLASLYITSLSTLHRNTAPAVSHDTNIHSLNRKIKLTFKAQQSTRTHMLHHHSILACFTTSFES